MDTNQDSCAIAAKSRHHTNRAHTNSRPLRIRNNNGFALSASARSAGQPRSQSRAPGMFLPLTLNTVMIALQSLPL